MGRIYDPPFDLQFVPTDRGTLITWLALVVAVTIIAFRKQKQ